MTKKCRWRPEVSGLQPSQLGGPEAGVVSYRVASQHAPMLVGGNLEPYFSAENSPLAVRKGSEAKRVRDLDGWDKTKKLWTAPDSYYCGGWSWRLSFLHDFFARRNTVAVNLASPKWNSVNGKRALWSEGLHDRNVMPAGVFRPECNCRA